MTTKNYAYKGRGSVFMGLASGGPVVEVGNTKDLKITIESETQELEDFESEAGGIAASTSWIKKAGVAMTLLNLSPENLARACLGNATAKAGAAVVDEEHVAYKDGHVFFEHIKPTEIAVKNEAGAVTYVKDTDYAETANGVLILAAGAITDGATIKVSYTHVDDVTVEAMTTGTKEYKIVFAGVNAAQDGRKRNVTLYRVRLSPAAELALMTGEWGEIQLTGTLLKDAGQPVGKSQYFVDNFEAAA